MVEIELSSTDRFSELGCTEAVAWVYPLVDPTTVVKHRKQTNYSRVPAGLLREL